MERGGNITRAGNWYFVKSYHKFLHAFEKGLWGISWINVPCKGCVRRGSSTEEEQVEDLEEGGGGGEGGGGEEAEGSERERVLLNQVIMCRRYCQVLIFIAYIYLLI